MQKEKYFWSITMKIAAVLKLDVKSTGSTSIQFINASREVLAVDRRVLSVDGMNIEAVLPLD